MQRNKFIASLLTAATLPLTGFAKLQHWLPRKNKGFKAPANEGRLHGHLKLQGINANVLDLKVSGSDTDGDLAIFEQNSLTPGWGTPLHIHPKQDEVFYVIEGSFRFKVGDDLFDLAVGDSIFLPRNVPHAWTQVSATGKMIVTLQPAGKLENFFVALAALKHEATQEEINQLFSENEMRVVGPPLKVD